MEERKQKTHGEELWVLVSDWMNSSSGMIVTVIVSYDANGG